MMTELQSRYPEMPGVAFCKLPRYRCHLCCILLKMAAISLLTDIFYSEGFAALSALPTPPSSPLIERCKAPQPGLSGPPSGEPPAPVGELSAELAAAGVPFCPNAQEPSDHILIAAELQLGAPAARRQAKPKATSRRKSRAKSPSASPPPASGLRRSSRLR